jgi:hypothetical protein
MNRYYHYKWIWIVAGLAYLSLACALRREPETAIPADRAAGFEIQTATLTPDASRGTVTLEVERSEQVDIVPLGDAPTHTPAPDASPTPLPLPTATPAPSLIEAVQPTPTATTAELPTPTPGAPQPPPAPVVVELDPPLEGGDWDFEASFVPWPNPFGEPCPGASVASGWTAFVEEGEYGSSCMNENLYRPNVFSGVKSQEITFDFIAANSGVWRIIPTQPGHRYNIVAYAKNDFSVSPVEMFLGIDLSGGAVWNAETVKWFPWDNKAADTWNATEETVTAAGAQMAVFIRGYHPLAEKGGKTVIDSVSVTHLGP